MKKLSFSNASMMYRLHHKLALLLFSLVVTSSQAQIYTIKVEPSEIDELLALKSAIQIPTFEMKGLNDAEIAHIKAEDEKNISLGKPPRVAVPIQARINTAEHGIWTKSRGKKLWLLEIEAKNASMIAPIFRQLNLEADAQIFMFTNDRQFLMGPITSENIPQNLETVSPDFLPSESITIAYFTEKESNLEVSGVNFVYNKSLAKVGFGAAFPCHIDVTDPLADAFKFEQNAVAVLLTNDDHGSAVCTATVVNNTNEDFRPLLLTANHCFDITVIPSTLRIRFRWQQGMISSTVSGVFINRRTFQGHITFVGANIKAQSEKKADFALIEMFNRISPSHNISFLGWDKVSTPQTSTILHHPQGDFMKITRDAQPAIHTAVTNQFFRNNGWELTFRQQNDFGFTEPGSSGSALLNEGHLISGQLSHSVPANCARIPSTAGFGRLGVSFVGNNTTSSRVGDYLAPSSSANTAIRNVDEIKELLIK